MRFWDVPNRKVLKIHGTIDDYSTIIVTRGDYNICADRLHKSLIGAKLKEILTSNTCIFIGYSIRDDDFRELFRFVREAQGKFGKTHYLVSPHANDEEAVYNIVPIATDGAYFLKCIKAHMCNNYCYLPDEILDLAEAELYYVIEEHDWLWSEHDPKQFPQILIAASYQDGLGRRLINAHP
jgi:SIR2-like domain